MRPRVLPVALALVAALVVGAGVGATVRPRVWHVDNTATPSGDGSSANPLATLAEAEQNSGSGDWIFVRAGDGSTRGLDSGIRLKPGQFLFGEEVGLELGGESVAPGATPVITNPDGPGVVLATGCEVAGIGIVSTAGPGILGAGVKGCRLRNLTISSPKGHGVELRDPAGDITIEGVEIDGAGGNGLDLVRSAGPSPARIELLDCPLRNIAEDAIDARLSGSAVITLTIEGCEFSTIAGAAATVIVEDEAAGVVHYRRNRVLSAGMGVVLTVLDSGRLGYDIVDNPEFSGIESTIVNFFIDPDSSREARAWGEIARNPKMSKHPGSGFGIRISSNGSGKASVVIRDNRISGGVEFDYGILAEARLGSAGLVLDLVGNEVVVGDEALEAVMVRSRDEAAVCARIEDNLAAGGVAGLRLQQRGASVFAISGSSAPEIDQVMAKHHLASANPGLQGVVATAETSFIGAAEGCGIQRSHQ